MELHEQPPPRRGLFGAEGLDVQAKRSSPTFLINKSLNRRLGVLTGAERMPLPGIQAQRPRTLTARTTRQINGAIFVCL